MEAFNNETSLSPTTSHFYTDYSLLWPSLFLLWDVQAGLPLPQRVHRLTPELQTCAGGRPEPRAVWAGRAEAPLEKQELRLRGVVVWKPLVKGDTRGGLVEGCWLLELSGLEKWFILLDWNTSEACVCNIYVTIFFQISCLDFSSKLTILPLSQHYFIRQYYLFMKCILFHNVFPCIFLTWYYVPSVIAIYFEAPFVCFYI